MSISKIEIINEHFKLPISYNENKMELKKVISDDLELIKTIDPNGTSMLEYAFQPTSLFGKKVLEQFTNHYTNDVDFLKDTQELLKKYKKIERNEMNEKNPVDFNEIMDIWNDIKNDTGFKEKYHYIDWPMWEFLNRSDSFLQLMSVYNLASPILSLFVPIIILIVPFFIIKLKGMDITMSEYFEVIKIITANHAIGKLFTQFNSVKTDEKMYILLSVGFYIFSIYQNILTCWRFHDNMNKIHIYLNSIKKYIEQTEESIHHFLLFSSHLKSYTLFNEDVKNKLEILSSLREKLNKITPWKLSINKIGELGHILKCFYDLYNDVTYNDTFLYSFGFNGYIDNLEGLIKNIDNKNIHYAKLRTHKKSKKNKNKRDLFNKSYYPALIHNKPIKNTYKFDKNLILTGPNASGKTTILKSVLINIIITQQMGCGFYDSAEYTPFKYIHCYLNIPDTSGRDSLFQAEVRRCKDILDVIQENKEERHFCGFDELYSGTNPDEAVVSATAFMEYIIKNKNVNCILTTHFIKLCHHLDKNKNIKNCKMSVDKSPNNDLIYKYKIISGITDIKGGVEVLKKMNYPEEIMKNINKLNE